MPQQEVLTRYGFEFDKGAFAAIERGVKRNVKNLGASAHHIDAFQQRMGGFMQRAKQIAVTYLGFRAVKNITSDYANGADAVAKFSTALGLNTERYQGLVHAAQLSGTTNEVVNKSLGNLAKRALEASQGLKTQQRAFGELGITVKDSQGNLKGADQLLLEMSDGLKGITDTSKRTGIAMQLLGNNGKAMLPLMLEGSKGIEKMIAEAKKLGIVLSKEQLKAAENYNDSMLRLKGTMTGLRNTIASKVLPPITRLVEGFVAWWTEGKNAEKAMRALKFVAIFTGAVLSAMIGASMLRRTSAFVSGLWQGVQALRAMGIAGAFAKLQVLAIFAAIALVGLIVEDLVGFAQGKDSLIGRILGDGSTADALRAALLGIAADAKAVWKELAPALVETWKELKPLLQELWTLLKPLLPLLLKVFISGLRGMIMLIRAQATSARLMIRLWRGVVIAVVFLFGVLRDAWGVVIGVMSSVVSTISDAFWGVYAIVSVILGGISAAFSAVFEAIGKALGVVGNVLEKIFGKQITGAAKSAAAAVKGAFQSVADALGKAFDFVTGKIIGAFKEVLDTADTAIKALQALAGAEIGTVGVDALGLTANRALAFAGGDPGATPGRAGAGAGVPFVAPRFSSSSVLTVAPGAVQLTIQANKDDVDGIVKKANVLFKESLSKVITTASRDLKKPPAGQR